LKTSSSKSTVRTFCARNSIGASSFVGEFPMRGHELDAEQLLRADHVRAVRPEGRRRALPAVAAVEQQRVRARGAQALHQRREVREAADLAIALRGALEVEVCERVGLGRSLGEVEMPEKSLAHEMRRLAGRRPGADVDRGLAEVDRRELRVRIRDMQQRDVAERRHVVELGRGLRLARAGTQRGSRCRGGGKKPQKLATLQNAVTG
jgi:hypothetical protein